METAKAFYVFCFFVFSTFRCVSDCQKETTLLEERPLLCLWVVGRLFGRKENGGRAKDSLQGGHFVKTRPPCSYLFTDQFTIRVARLCISARVFQHPRRGTEKSHDWNTVHAFHNRRDKTGIVTTLEYGTVTKRKKCSICSSWTNYKTIQQNLLFC